MNVQVCTILVGCHDRALDVPSWLKPEINPKTMRAFQPTNFSPKEKIMAGLGLAWSAWSPLTWPSWLSWLRFPWSKCHHPTRAGWFGFQVPVIAKLPLQPEGLPECEVIRTSLLIICRQSTFTFLHLLEKEDAKQWSWFGLLIRRSRIFFTQAMIQLLFFVSFLFILCIGKCVSITTMRFSSVALAVAWRSGTSFLEGFMNATLNRTLPSPTTAMPVVVALVTAAVGSALKETQNRTCTAAWLYHTLTALSGALKMIVVLTICFIALLTKKSSNPISEMRQCQNTPQLRKVTAWNGELTKLQRLPSIQRSSKYKYIVRSTIYIHIHTAWSVQRME